MNLFCSKVNGEAEGHHQAIRLISHKIQSPQEHEALRTLELLEVCVQSCGSTISSGDWQIPFSERDDQTRVAQSEQLSLLYLSDIDGRCLHI